MKGLINRITKWLNDVDEADVFFVLRNVVAYSGHYTFHLQYDKR